MTIFNIDTLRTKHVPTLNFWSRNSIQFSKLASLMIGTENKVSFFENDDELFLKIDNEKGLPLIPMNKSYNHRINSRPLIEQVKKISGLSSPRYEIKKTDDQNIFELKLLNHEP